MRMIKNIFLLCMMSILLTFNCKKENTDIDDSVFGVIEKNIYYKTLEDASVIPFKNNGLNYKEIVFNEFFPVTKEFQKRVYNNETDVIVKDYISNETKKDLMENFSKKGIKFKSNEEFEKHLIETIQQKKENIKLGASLDFLTDKTISWNKYKWKIEPCSGPDETGKFSFTFNIIVETGEEKPYCYAFKFSKYGEKYYLTLVDVVYDKMTGPFYGE